LDPEAKGDPTSKDDRSVAADDPEFPIVEQSRGDQFWGALKVKDARDMLQSERSLPDVSDLNIFSRPVSQWLAEGD